MDKEKQITKIVKLEIVESVSFKDLKSAYINDMRISKSKPLSEMKTIVDIDCREDYILEALGYSKDSVVLSKENYDKLCHLAYFGYEDYYEKGKKETAEKYHNEIRLWIKACICMHYISLEHGNALLNDNDKLAKQFSVEIKE